MRLALLFTSFLIFNQSHATPVDLLSHWTGRFRVKTCHACSARYRLAPDFSLNDLKEVEVTTNSTSIYPVCIDRTYVGEFQKTKMGNCFTYDQVSGDSTRLTLRKTFPDLFDLFIVLTRVKGSQEIRIAIRRVTRPAVTTSPFGETANLAIDLTLEELSRED